MTPLTQLLAAAALSTVICVAMANRGVGAAAQDVTVGGFVAFITAMLMLIAYPPPGGRLPTPTRGVAALERGLNLLEAMPLPRLAARHAPARARCHHPARCAWRLQPTRRPR